MLNLLISLILLTCSSCFILNFNIIYIYILLKILVSTEFFTNSAGLLFRLMESNRSLIILIIELIHSFQHGAIFHKTTFSNINLLKKSLLIVVLVFFKVKIMKGLSCNIVSSEDLLKINYLCHLISKFSDILQFHLS